MREAVGDTSDRGLRLEGARCRELRRERGLTQQQLAHASRGPDSLSLATIKRAERGDPIDVGSARRLAGLLGAELSALRSNHVARVSHHAGTALLRRTAIAVLPFYVAAADRAEWPEAEYVGDGLAEDLLCRLGVWWFPVISRCSTMRYRGELPTPEEIGEKLNCRYLVTGSVRRQGDLTRIYVEVCETELGEVVWSGQVEDHNQSLFELQERVCMDIARRIGSSVLETEAARAYRAPDPESLDAWQIGLRGAWHYYRSTRSDNLIARDYLQEALRRDSRMRCAHYWLCMTYQRELSQQWTTTPARALQELVEVAREFRRFHPHDPYMHTATAYGLVYSGQRSAALASLEAAISLDQNLTTARSLYGQVLAMSGRPEDALRELETALRLSPLDPQAHLFKVGIALSYFVMERYQDMVLWSEAALQESTENSLGYGALACGLAYLGEVRRAQLAVRKMESHSGAGEGLRVLLSSTEPEIATRFLRGLQLAGFSR